MAELRLADPALAERFSAILEDPSSVIVTDDVPSELPDDPVIVLGSTDDVLDILRTGVRGVLPRSASAAQLRTAVEAVARGLVVLAPEAAEALFEPASEPETALTPRELEVLVLLAEGASNKAIARRLGISFHTAKFHVGAILSKLGARSRADAVAQGMRLGLLLL